MAKYVKGHPGNPKGRGKGIPNVSTREAREILSKILIAEIPKLVQSLENVRMKDDAKYIDCMNKLLSDLVPRRTDLTSDDAPLNAGFLGMTKEEIEAELAQWRKH
jgi:hypothetical protein